MRAWILVLFSFSCSGSGDAPTDAGNGLPDVALAPYVVSVSPDPGTLNVPRAARIDAAFNVKMDAATIDATTMTVMRGAEAISGTVTYDAATRTASFTPASQLARVATLE